LREDGVYLQARMEANAECMLVLIGATVGQSRPRSSRPAPLNAAINTNSP